MKLFFVENMVKYICVLFFLKKVRKYGKKNEVLKYYITIKNWTYKLMPNVKKCTKKFNF